MRSGKSKVFIPLATHISSFPHRFTASFTSLVLVSGFVTSSASSSSSPTAGKWLEAVVRDSAVMTSASCFNAWSWGSSLGRPRWFTATLHPCRRNSRAIAFPIPVVPPLNHINPWIIDSLKKPTCDYGGLMSQKSGVGQYHDDETLETVIVKDTIIID